MQIRTYDEVDPYDVYQLTLAAFGWGLVERWVRQSIRRDPRVLEGFAIYAVERGKLLAQVIPLRMSVRLTCGPEAIGAIAGVCSHPSVWGKGYARRLMKNAHEMYRELGLRISTLTTSRNIRGYRLYRKLGYVDLALFYRALRKVPAKRTGPEGIRLRKAHRRDLPIIQALFEQYTQDLYGWTLRSPKLLPFYVSREAKALDPFHVVARDGVAVGYVRTHPEEHVLLEEVIAPKARDFRAAVRLMEARSRDRIVTTGYVSSERDRDRYTSLGYDICGPIPPTTMAVSIDDNLRAQNVRRLFGGTQGRFAHYPTDDF